MVEVSATSLQRNAQYLPLIATIEAVTSRRIGLFATTPFWHCLQKAPGAFMPKKLSRYRDESYVLQRGRCIYCEIPMPCQRNLEAFAKRYDLTPRQAKNICATAEHLVAHCVGGALSRKNIAAACGHCNRERHARRRPLDPMTYKRYVLERMKRGRWHADFVFKRLLNSESHQMVGSTD